MNAKDEKKLKKLVRNLPADLKVVPLEEFIAAWVSDVDPAQPADESHTAERIDTANKLQENEEADNLSMLLEPCDSASQVGSNINIIGKDVQRFIETKWLNLHAPKRPVSQAQAVKIFRQYKAEKNKQNSAAQNGHGETPRKVAKLNDGPWSSTRSKVSFAKKFNPDIAGPTKADEKITQENKLGPMSPQDETVIIRRKSVVNVIKRYVKLDYDESFVKAVEAAGVVFLRRVFARLNRTDSSDGRDFINRDDMLNLYHKLGVKCDDHDFGKIIEIFKSKASESG